MWSRFRFQINNRAEDVNLNLCYKFAIISRGCLESCSGWCHMFGGSLCARLKGKNGAATYVCLKLNEENIRKVLVAFALYSSQISRRQGYTLFSFSSWFGRVLRGRLSIGNCA
ncbi:hypothetical protein KP509_05G014600 [Ceratopteris richardii]|uniref:Uncharacterized protein n=1 Tax=Ceratopteris richardii TaxID=49495 RepID=A0A8T2URE1_CERRI|nr:hypothetical protein KP509_05G014600 [Ceratopteris richardii]